MFENQDLVRHFKEGVLLYQITYIKYTQPCRKKL